jgi:outer membrane protein assembly factor BamB
LSTDSGRQLWRFAAGGPVMAGAVIANGHLYAIAENGILSKLDARSGKLQWSFDTHGGGLPRDLPSLTSARYDEMTSAPAVAGGVVYVGSADHRLYAVADDSGRERWHFATGDAIRSTPAVADGRVYFGSYDNHVYALDAGSGDLLWSFDTLQPVVSSPLVARGKVFVGSRDANLFAFDARSGEVRWKSFYWSSWVESSARILGDTLYVGSSDWQRLLAIDADSGREVWSFGTGGSAWSTPAVSEKTVFIGVVGTSGYFLDHRGGFFAVDRVSGTPLWTYSLPPISGSFTYGVATSPAVDTGRVFFGSLDGTFYAFRADGEGPR